MEPLPNNTTKTTEEINVINAEKARQLDELLETIEKKKTREKAYKKKHHIEKVKPRREAERSTKNGITPRKTHRSSMAMMHNEPKDMLESFVKRLVYTKPNKSFNVRKLKTKLDDRLRYDHVERYETTQQPNGPRKKTNMVDNASSVIIRLIKPDRRFSSGIQSMDLFEIRQSIIENAGMGLFSKRMFKQGDIIGLYYGKVRKQEQPTSSEYQVECHKHGIIVDAEGGVESGKPLYFGIHMANDPILRVKSRRMTTREKKHTQTHNFFIDEDLVAIASQDINKGDELYLYYGWETEYDKTGFECTCDGCNYRRINYEERIE